MYTKGGDKGKTSLGTGERVLKNTTRIDAIGHVDELNAWMGVCILYCPKDHAEDLRRIQHDLFDLGGDLCMPEQSQKKKLKILSSQVTWLEKEIDEQNKSLPPLSSFILPGGTSVSSYLHLARTVARRAERSVIALSQETKINEEAIMYLNRLSDYLFVLCRTLNNKSVDDVLWIPGKNQMEVSKK
ncbi:MAG: cob(I)yrinic acid a,c-diamide adenosyltransferase [Holosporaceae bacterium]|nr:MAG: cob(I)yrinic acid a,c-diamide adenosyltransferase [Holosporaceae bacterium]